MAKGDKSKSNKKVEIPAPAATIAVTAMRAGVYRNSRKKVGAKFAVGSMDELGSWMKCDNPDMEKQRRVLFAEKAVKRAEAVKAAKKSAE